MNRLLAARSPVSPEPMGFSSYVWFAVLILGIGLTAFIHPLFPFVILGGGCILVFAEFISIHWLYIALLFSAIIAFPIIPPFARHFSSPLNIGGFYIQDFLFAALFGVWVTKKIARFGSFPLRRFPKTLIQRLFLFHIIIFCICAIIGLLQNRVDFWVADVREFMFFSLFWVFLDEFSEITAYNRTLTVFLWIAILYGALSFIDSAFFRGFARYNSGVSPILLVSLFLILSIFLTPSYKARRGLLVVGFFICLLGLLVTFTRGYFLGFVVGLISILVVGASKQSVKITIGIVLAFLLIFFLMDYMGVSFSTFSKATTDRGEALVGSLDISSAERLLEVLAVLEEFPKHPLLGVGVGGTIHVYKFGDMVVKAGFVDWWFIHNNYAQILHKSGIIGFIATLSLWITVVIKASRLYKIISDPIARVILLSAISTTLSFMAISMSSPMFSNLTTNILVALLFAGVVSIERSSFQLQKLLIAEKSTDIL